MPAEMAREDLTGMNECVALRTDVEEGALEEDELRKRRECESDVHEDGCGAERARLLARVIGLRVAVSRLGEAVGYLEGEDNPGCCCCRWEKQFPNSAPCEEPLVMAATQ